MKSRNVCSTSQLPLHLDKMSKDVKRKQLSTGASHYHSRHVGSSAPFSPGKCIPFFSSEEAVKLILRGVDRGSAESTIDTASKEVISEEETITNQTERALDDANNLLVRIENAITLLSDAPAPQVYALKLLENFFSESEFRFAAVMKSMYLFHGTDAAMHELFCSALGKWAVNATHREQITQNNGFDIILRAMRLCPNNGTIQMHACEALLNLYYDNMCSLILTHLEDAVCEVMDALENCNIIAEVHKKGCQALSVILAHVESQNFLDVHRAFDVITNGMKLHKLDAESQCTGCMALWHLAPLGDANGDDSCIVLKTIMNLTMINHRKDTAVQRWSLTVLSKYSSNREHMDLIADAGSLSAIGNTVIIHSLDAKVVELFCGLLWKIAKCADDDEEKRRYATLDHILSMGVIKLLVNSFRTHRDNYEVQESICSVVSILAIDSKIADKIVSSGGLKAIVGAMMASTQKIHLQREACRSLLRLAHHTHHHESIGNFGGIYALVDAMCYHPLSEDIQTEASYALTKLSFSTSNVEMLCQSQARPVLERAGQMYPQTCGGHTRFIISRMESSDIGRKIVTVDRRLSLPPKVNNGSRHEVAAVSKVHSTLKERENKQRRSSMPIVAKKSNITEHMSSVGKNLLQRQSSMPFLHSSKSVKSDRSEVYVKVMCRRSRRHSWQTSFPSILNESQE